MEIPPLDAVGLIKLGIGAVEPHAFAKKHQLVRNDCKIFNVGPFETPRMAGFTYAEAIVVENQFKFAVKKRQGNDGCAQDTKYNGKPACDVVLVWRDRVIGGGSEHENRGGQKKNQSASGPGQSYRTRILFKQGSDAIHIRPSRSRSAARPGPCGACRKALLLTRGGHDRSALVRANFCQRAWTS